MRPSRFLGSIVPVAVACCFLFSSLARCQGAKEVDSQTPVPDSDRDHIKERNEWFYRGRIVRGLPSAELRRRAYQSKLGLRKQRAASPTQSPNQTSFATASWIPLGPVPLASDASRGFYR